MEPIRIDAWAHVPTGTVIWDGFMVPLQQAVAERSGGSVALNILPVGEIAPRDLAQAVGSGRIDSAESSMLDTGSIPEAAVATSPPFSYTDVRQILDFWYRYRGGEAIRILERAYARQGLKLVTLIPFCGTYGVMTRFPIRGVDDVRGKRFRSIGTYAHMVKTMGGEPLHISLSDTYDALKNGEIQGVVMDLSGLVDYRWQELIDYVMLPPIVPSSPTAYLFNLEKWNALPPQARRAIEDAARQVVSGALYDYSRALEQRAFRAIADSGIQVVTLQGEELRRYRAVGDPLWADIAARSDNNRYLVDLLKAYLAEQQ